MEDFDFTVRPSTARITARGEALAFTLARQHMAGPGSAWFEPTSPLVFELDSGDVHVIPRRLIESVEPSDSDEPHKADEQTLMIRLRPGAGVHAVAIFAKTEAVSAWAELSTAEG
ncbi:hypothetical protein AB0478_30820 [Streptomyces sp. NPDC051917]|uniref:hypothetical protein n=1 Tax=Streptomyces sp. NPDC051917 TaxID=3154754 RepID=UPI00344BCC05